VNYQTRKQLESEDRKAFLAGLGAAVTAAAWPSGARAESGVTVLRAARLFDGTAMHTPGVLVLKGSKIVSIYAGDDGSDATTIDLGDATRFFVSERLYLSKAVAA